MGSNKRCTCAHCRPRLWRSWAHLTFTGLFVGVSMTPVWVLLVRATAQGAALQAALLDGLFTAVVWGFTLTVARRPTWWFVVGVTLGSAGATYFTLC